MACEAPVAAVRIAPPSIWRSASATIGTRAIDIPSRYGFHILVAWKLGLVDAGAFYIVFSVLTIVAGFGRLGLDKAMTREVARALAQGRGPRVHAVIRRGMLTIAGLSVLAGGTMALLAPLIALHAFHSARLTMPLVFAGITIVPLCVSAGAAGAIAGLHRVAASQMIYSWLWPALFCLFAAPLALTLQMALGLIVVATSVATAISLVLLVRMRPVESGPAERSPPLLGLGLSLFTTEIVQLLLAGLPGLVLGIFAGDAVVGAYAMAWRLALVLNLLVVAVGAMASPRFADCAERGDAAGLRRTAAQSLALVLVMGLVPLVILAIGAPWLLMLFGRGFVAGTAELRLLLLGQMVLMVSATAPELLGMTGHEKAMQHVNVAAIAIYAPALLALSWAWGGQGAALANLIAALVSGGGALWLVHRWFGFTPPSALMAMIRTRRHPAVA